VRIGINGRLDTLQAGILQAKFDIFPEEVEKRQIVANRYSNLIAAVKYFTVPYIPEGYKSAWAQYTILAKDEKHRADSQKRLQDKGIPTAIYYPTPLHMQTAFSPLGYKKYDLPISEDCANRAFSLPMHPYLTEEQQKQVVDVLAKEQ
jgi:dTDP-4-amino-4,6-dideoxygalactose transaminase